MSSDLPHLGRLLRRHRETAELSLSDVSSALEAAGIDRSRQTVQNWESGRARPPVDALSELSRILSVSAVDRIALYQAAGQLVIVEPTEAA